MKYTYEIIPERNLVRETWKGQISKRDLIEAISRIIADPEWKRHMDVISDFRNAQIELSTQETKDYADWILQKDTPRYQAIVVGRTLDYGMARMFEVLTGPDHYDDSYVFYEI